MASDPVEIVGLVLEIGQGLSKLFLVGARAAEGDGLLIDRLGVIGFARAGEKLALGEGDGFQVGAFREALFEIGFGLREDVGLAEVSLREEKIIGGVLGRGIGAVGNQRELGGGPGVVAGFA